jgi:hypothetical protein
VSQSIVGELSTAVVVRCHRKTLTERAPSSVVCWPFLEDLVTGTTQMGHATTVRTSPLGRCRIIVCMPPATAGAESDAGIPRTSVTEDRGSFSHGVCRACGWIGPGRRSRRVAGVDAARHVGTCPGAAERE